MLDITDFKRLDGETDEQLILRVCRNKASIGSWEDVSKVLNTLLGTEYRPNTFRNKFQSYTKFRPVDIQDSEQSLLDEIKEERRELEKEKVRFRDERNEYNHQNRQSARVEQKLDYLEEVLSNQGKINYNTTNTVRINSDSDMLVMISDLHVGQCFNSAFGKYNSDIAKERLEKYLNEIIKIQERHNCEKCYVSINGDLISGNIHKTISVTNRENVIDQIKLASELITSFCYELTKVFNVVFMMDCSGNHSRLEAKDDALHSERLDDLIGWIVSKSLSHIDNFHVMNRKLDIGIADFNIRGKTYISCHGDFDDFSKNGVSNLSFLLGFIPYAILVGHRHFPAMSDFNGVKMIQCGSLVGSGDDYTIEKRLTGKASQTVCICDDKGIECMYPVELN